MTAKMTIVRIPARELRAGDQYLTEGGQLREVAKVWSSRDARLFAGSRARVETIQARLIGGTSAHGWDPETVLTVARPTEPSTYEDPAVLAAIFGR